MKKYVAIYTEEENLFKKYMDMFDSRTNLLWIKSDLAVEDQIEKDVVIPAMIINPSKISTEVALKIPGLRLIQVTSAGTDHIDVITLNENGILVANNNGGNSVAVAEHTIALMLSVYRKLPRQFSDLKSGSWSENRSMILPTSHDLSGQKIGIIGFGHIGKKVARRLQGWECEISYNDIIKLDESTEHDFNVRFESREDLIKSCDIITLHVPLNRETTGMISDREFKQMKSNAIVINACRGPVIDEKSLINALDKKYITGAGLDVTEKEPIETDNPLLRMDNVVITPHLASLTQESIKKSSKFAVENTTRVFNEEEGLSIVLPL
tara:strand:- start:835 stop:1806 length:972 start_codon:yes stop_codon:yes gene_type:complete